MTVVIDTNIFISKIIKRNQEIDFIFSLWEQEVIKVAISPEIHEEYRKVLNYPHIRKLLNDSKHKLANLLLDKLTIMCKLVDISKYKEDIVEKDSTDNKFVYCALESNAQFLISGDKHLLELKKYRNLHIIKAKNFMDLMRKEDISLIS